MTRPVDDRRQSTRRRWIVWLLIVLAVVGPIYARALVQARAEVLRGNALLTIDPYRAVTSYRHAVEWYAPGNPYSAQAVDALLEIGMDDGPHGPSPDLSLRALESLRSAILVTRSVYTPYADTLPEVERRIASLRGQEAASRSGSDPVAEAERQLTLLRASRDRTPNAVWSLVVTVAFALWIALTWLFIRSAFGGDTKRRRRSALLGCSAAATLVVWIVGLFLV